MTRQARRLVWPVATILATIPVLRIAALQAPNVNSSLYVAAEIHYGSQTEEEVRRGGHLFHVLTIYPLDGRPVTIPLPDTLPKTLSPLAFSSDGRAIYIKTADGITKVELQPMRLATVDGSQSIGSVWHLTDSSQSAKLFGSGVFGGSCGAFEIDPSTGSFRALRTAPLPYQNCGGASGQVSTDGRRELSFLGNELDVLDLETGIKHSLGPGLSDGRWSPDGRWIAAWGTGRIVIIDADNVSHRKDLGKCCDRPVEWSPDSKLLLLTKSELRCALYLYFDSLQVLDVETGKRTVIKSSRCNTGGWVGWVDRRVVE
jgi:hypothetical protein